MHDNSVGISVGVPRVRGHCSSRNICGHRRKFVLNNGPKLIRPNFSPRVHRRLCRINRYPGRASALSEIPRPTDRASTRRYGEIEALGQRPRHVNCRASSTAFTSFTGRINAASRIPRSYPPFEPTHRPLIFHLTGLAGARRHPEFTMRWNTNSKRREKEGAIYVRE